MGYENLALRLFPDRRFPDQPFPDHIQLPRPYIASLTNTNPDHKVAKSELIFWEMANVIYYVLVGVSVGRGTLHLYKLVGEYACL